MHVPLQKAKNLDSYVLLQFLGFPIPFLEFHECTNNYYSAVLSITHVILHLDKNCLLHQFRKTDADIFYIGR